MEFFDKQFDAIAGFLENLHAAGKIKETMHHKPMGWPTGGDRNLVLGQDTGVELGSPKFESTAFILWGNHADNVHDRRISLIGPDLPESVGKALPFGKVVLIGGQGFSPDNAYDRYREMEMARYDVDLKGYMMRAVSQYLREWSRVSLDAVKNGFSFDILGGALIDQYKEKDYISAVEVIFVTSEGSELVELKGIGEEAARITNAMNKMADEMSFDCDTCDYTDVCQDVAALRSMKKALDKGQPGGSGES